MFRLTLLFILCSITVYSQDTIKTDLLKEVVIIHKRSLSDQTDKPLSTLDKYLEKSNMVNMVRRGAYAWEPYLNGMTAERSVVTIDGMRIYAACTDKMDPVTSYVDITNLAKVNVHSGQSGSAGGAAIAGSLDLVRNKGTFGEKNLSGMLFTGFETNSQQQVIGGAMAYAQPKLFANLDFTYRHAGNYKAGGGEEVLYSQYTKYNVSAIAGYKVNEHARLEASLIYDRAVNVGYPALTMDVGLARGVIASLAYIRHGWETKVYYNTITHVMDDTKRPVVAIRMDMPGWSKTAGFYSSLQGLSQKHSWKANISGHYNKSLAEMTMFSNTAGEKDMFMLTWPGVLTYYGDVYGEDNYAISKHWRATINGGAGVQDNIVDDHLGLESLKIFYPGMGRSKLRLLKRLSTALNYTNDHVQYTLGVAYGERAPSVSEGYGYYLFNSFDRYDYIGNPEMKNEKSVSLNGAVLFHRSWFSGKLSASYFHLMDYIIGRPRAGLSVMTIGAAGVKVYEQLAYANIFNIGVEGDIKLNRNFTWSNRLGYRSGSGENVKHLPLIQPFTYSSGLAFSLKSFTADVTCNGAAAQDRYNPEFGEQALPAYAVLNVSASYKFNFGKQSLMLKTGAENLFDKRYTTFADWNRVPRMGRNVFVNIIWSY
ncbi:TonB-dependent receptor domain-containing protein [Chitinophaga sancti]|uniref:TonB-dependent receptor plug domain-containing protein n=1 Tax=Chitinophaga sancti TaxID=1004 RepID=UPI003F7AA201